MDLVIGVDAGGTSTRCLVADTSGRIVGAATAAGINQRSSGGDPVDRLVEAVWRALGDHDPAAVRAGVLGVAGAGAAGLSLAARHADDAWQRLGIESGAVVVPDLLVAFAAGTPAPTGTVLVAGTGAGAAAVADRRVARQADGAGWLVGDIGSSVWLAREGLVAAVADLDGRGPATALTRPLVDRLLGGPGPHGVQDVIGGVYAVPPASLGTLAPVVADAVETGDEVARDIVRRGVAGLMASLDAVRGDGPLVLAGALLTGPGPVLTGVTGGLADRGLAPALPAHRPSVGAAWLALVSLGVTDESVHARLTHPG